MNKKELLIIAIISFVTICAWVIFDIIHNTSQVTIPAKVQEVIEPIDPNFDLSAIE